MTNQPSGLPLRCRPVIGQLRSALRKSPPSALPSTLPVVVYTPDTGLRHPIDLVRGLWHDAFCPQSRSLAWRLVIRNLSAQFRQSLLGYFWLFFPPLLNSVLFIFLNSRKIISIPDTGVPYPVFVMLGNLLWQALLQLMMAPIQGVQSERGLLTKLNFSREALLVAGFLQGLTTACIPLLATPFILVAFRIPFGASMLFAPVGIAALCIFAFAIGVFLTPMGTLYHDIGRAIPFLARFWFFVTPVIYALPDAGRTRTLLMLNPATPFIETARDWMLGQPTDVLPLFLVYTALSILLLMFGLIVYRLAMPIIVERMSA